MAMMISKFHKIIQSKIVWTVFAILISVAFVSVYTGSKSSGQQKRAQKEAEVAGHLYGEEVSRIEFGRAYRSLYVIYSLSFGQAINISEEVDEILTKATWQRLVTLKKAEKMGLRASPQETIAMIQNQPVFQNQQTGQFDKNVYDAVVKGFLPSTGMRGKDLEILFTENVLIDKASKIATQGALVTDEEIRKAFHIYTDMLTVEYASIPRSLADEPKVTEDDAKTYFEKNQEEFRMPEKVMVDYVQFTVSDYTNAINITDEQVATFYENNKQRFLKPEAATNAIPEYTPLDDVKETIASGLVAANARTMAIDAADALVASLADEGSKFRAVAEKAGLKIENTPAFTKTDQVNGIDPSAPFAPAAFALEDDPTHYYSDPVVGRDFVYVLSLAKKLPSFLPPYDVVKADATEAARIVATQEAYVEKADIIHAKIKSEIKNGTSFSKAAKNNKLDPTTTEPFNMTTELEDELGNYLKGATLALDAGVLSELIQTGNEYLIAYVVEKIPGDELNILPSMRAELAVGIENEKSSTLAKAWQESLLVEADFEDVIAQTNTDDES